MLTLIISLLPTLKEKLAKFEAKWKQMRQEAKPEDFEGYQSVAMAGKNDEVIDHYPP